jgi:ribosomal protein S18 acetylase RimI-like enzyme
MITYSKTRKPSAAQMKGLYLHAPWALRRRTGQIARMLKKLDLFFSAWSRGRLVGFCRCSTDFCFRAVLWDVIVDPALRRQGIGAALVGLVLKDPRLKNVDQFWLYTTDQQAFYKSLGFGSFPGHVLLLKKPAFSSRRRRCR